jgi:S1-C subfamily serine protease
MPEQKHFLKQAVFMLAIFLAVFLGGMAAVTYPSWYQSLPFKDSLPDFLKPQTRVETIVNNGQEVIRTVEESAVIDVVDKASPAVVSILEDTVELDIEQGPVQSQQGIGTGFIIDSSGIVITNNHVVRDTTIKYTVLTKSNKKYSVKKIDRDPSNDFAILKVDAKDLPILKFGDSSTLKVGQKVVAIGNALGRFGNTVTVGVVSGIGRGLAVSSLSSGISQSTLENVIQTDAALNPGNSGGPLLDLSGNAVGINFAVSQNAENIGFVIPINVVKNIIDGYRKEGKIIKPYIGVSYQMVSKDVASVQDLPEGAFVRRVLPNTPADEAGLRAGDVIIKIDSKDVNEDNTLASVLTEYKVGDTIELEVNRDGQIIKLKAKLGEAPQE